MAKRTTRSEADDGAAGTPDPKSRRARTRTTKETTAAGAARQVTADDPTVASAPTLQAPPPTHRDPADQRPPEDTIAADPRVTEASHFGQPTQEEIRRRAYELYVQRGGKHGMDEDDWYRAERELRSRRPR